MPYTRLRYHIVTATSNREPLIQEDIEAKIYQILRARATDIGGAILRAGGTPTHIHLLAAIPPAISVAGFVQTIKSTSSRKINQFERLTDPFAWQPGYGAFTVNPARLDRLIRYIDNQEQHHLDGSLQPHLERIP